jgi:hypothetical protein
MKISIGKFSIYNRPQIPSLTDWTMIELTEKATVPFDISDMKKNNFTDRDKKYFDLWQT